MISPAKVFSKANIKLVLGGWALVFPTAFKRRSKRPVGLSLIRPFAVALFSLSLAACGGAGDTRFDTAVGGTNYSAGDIDVSRYVAIGDSLTAGYKDGSLYLDGQLDSLPNILAGLLAEVGGGSFAQPLVSDNLGGLLLLGSPLPGAANQQPRLVLTSVDGNLTPVRQSGTPTTDIADIQVGPFNNLGLPGAKSFHLSAAAYGDISGLAGATANPYFVRFASSSTTSVLADALAQVPTFFSLWIGANDILFYAAAGGTGNDSSTSPAYGLASEDITDPVNVFAPSYTGLVAALRSTGAKGVLINIPAIIDIPFFTTVTFNALPLDDASAAAANAAYAAYNAGLSAALAGLLITQAEADMRTIAFAAGQNAIVIEDENLTDLSGLGLPNYRQASADDFILLPLASTLGSERIPGDPTTLIGIGSPLIDAEVLTADEASEVEAARGAYNTTISGLAAADEHLAFFDVAALLEDLNDGDGISYGTGSVDSTFASGGAFSLDGIHPTARGYAIIANGIIDQLNESFNADLPRADPGTYSEVFFEFPDGFDFSP